MSLVRQASVLLLLACSSAALWGQAIINGSFEYYTTTPPTNTLFYGTPTFVSFSSSDGPSAWGNNVPVGWQITGGAAQAIINTAYGAGAFPAAVPVAVAGGIEGVDQMTQATIHANTYYVYLGDSGQASMLTQSGLALTAGTTYQLSFQLSALTFGGAPEARAAVLVSNGSESFSPTYFATQFGGGWQTHTFLFTPTMTDDYALTFASFSSFNTALDNVSLTAIPEPSTYAMLFGVTALAGVMIHRRRRTF